MKEDRPITAGPHDRVRELDTDTAPHRRSRLEEVPVDVIMRDLSRNPWRFGHYIHDKASRVRYTTDRQAGV